MLVWRLRRKVIRIAPCCVVYDSCAQDWVLSHLVHFIVHRFICVCLYVYLCLYVFLAFSALTLLVGCQEGHLTRKNLTDDSDEVLA